MTQPASTRWWNQPFAKWVKTKWHFQKAIYPCRDIPVDKWTALPDITE